MARHHHCARPHRSTKPRRKFSSTWSRPADKKHFRASDAPLLAAYARAIRFESYAAAALTKDPTDTKAMSLLGKILPLPWWRLSARLRLSAASPSYREDRRTAGSSPAGALGVERRLAKCQLKDGLHKCRSILRTYVVRCGSCPPSSPRAGRRFSIRPVFWRGGGQRMPRYHFAVLNTSSRHEVIAEGRPRLVRPTLAFNSVDVRPTKGPFCIYARAFKLAARIYSRIRGYLSSRIHSLRLRLSSMLA